MLKDILRKKNISLYRLAAETGIPYTTLNDLKNGRVESGHMSADHLHRLSKAFAMTMDELYEQLLLPELPQACMQQDLPVSNRLRQKVRKLRIPIAEYDTEARFEELGKDWYLIFSYKGEEYRFLFEGLISNQRFDSLPALAAYLVQGYLEDEDFERRSAEVRQSEKN